jgi:hypothetical protein
MEILIAGPSWAEITAAVGSCAGAIAVGIGVYVAWRQLRSIRENEIIRATIEYLEQYQKPILLVGVDRPISPEFAANHLSKITSAVGQMDNYRDDAKAFFTGALRREKGDAAAERVLEETSYVLVAANYFIVAETLIRRRRLDEELVFDVLAKQIWQIWRFAEKFKDFDLHSRQIYYHLRFKEIAKRAEAWYQEHLGELLEQRRSEGASPTSGTHN